MLARGARNRATLVNNRLWFNYHNLGIQYGSQTRVVSLMPLTANVIAELLNLTLVQAQNFR